MSIRFEKNNKFQEGFTFLEVMAAIVVISVMSLTSVYLVKNTNEEFIQVNTTRRAYEFAQSKILEIVNDNNLPDYSDSFGVMDEDESFEWTSEVHEASSGKIRVLQVTVKNKAAKVEASVDYLFMYKE